MDSTQICRACSAPGLQHVKFDNTIIFNYHLLTSILVDVSDGLPQGLCSKCMDHIDSFVQFRQLCIINETRLQDLDVKKIKEEKEVFNDSTSIPKTSLEQTEYLNNDDNNHYYDENSTEIKSEETQIAFDEEQISIDRMQCSDDSTNVCEETENIKKQMKVGSRKVSTKRRRRNKATRKYSHNDSDVNNKKKNRLNCGLCDLSIEVNSLERHLEKHKRKRKCQLCGFHHSEWYKLLAHRVKHLSPHERRCHACKTQFRSELTAERHLIKYHKYEVRIIHCLWCSEKFSKRGDLKRHVKRAHSDTPKFICDYCGVHKSSKQILAAHIQYNHIEYTRQKCKDCDLEYRNPIALYNHRLKYHPNFKCKKCLLGFNSQRRMDTHKCCPGEVGVHVCEKCGKVFSRATNLQRHLTVHSTENLFKCPLCPKTYKSNKGLYDHKLRHEGQKRHKCDYCSMRFTCRGTLVKHVRTHTGEKPYVCELCGRGFTGSNNLKVHMKVHGILVKKKKDDVNTNASQSFESIFSQKKNDAPMS